MPRLKYFTESKVGELQSHIEKRLSQYYTPSKEIDIGHNLQVGDLRRTDIEFTVPDLELRDNRPDRFDSVNSIRLYESIPSLTRHQASDERLWTYLCHTSLAEYVKNRWLVNRVMPKSRRDRIRRVRHHFFVSGSRGVIRDNGVSRLWWLGFVAHKIDPKNPARFLEIVLYRHDVRSALLERPFLSRNPKMLSAVYEVMREHWEHDQQKLLFRRKSFRGWMIRLNRRGGVILFDAISPAKLVYIFRKEAEHELR